MALFDRASLVQIPSGYKEGKLYNIKPFDQPFEFERGSAATRVNEDGLIEYVDIGEELINYDDFNYGSGGFSLVGNKWFFDDVTNGHLNILVNEQINVVVGETYEVVVDVSISSGNASFRLTSGNSQTILFNYRDFPDGVTKFTTTVTGIDGLIQRLTAPTSVNDGAFTLNSISVKKISNDTPRIDYTNGKALLLEPQRTNLIAYSEAFDLWGKVGSPTITNNYGISPEGVKNSTRFQAISDRITMNVGSVGVGETFSFYAKGSGTLRIEIGGTNNFYPVLTSECVRYDFTTTSAGTSNNVQIRGNGSAVDVELYGAQYEQGSYATSYIPTNGQTETRLADVCGTGGYDSVFNNSQGTLYMEFNSPTEGNSSAWINLSSGTDTDDWLFFGKDQDKLRVYLKQNNVVETSDTSTNLPTDFAKVAVTYNTNSFKLNVNGVEVFDKNISPNFANNLDTLSFGSTTSTPLPEKIEVKALHYFPEALTDTELQQLTTI